MHLHGENQIANSVSQSAKPTIWFDPRLPTHSVLQVWKARWACFQRTRWNQRSVPTRYPQLPILLGVSPTACWRTLRIPLQHSKTWPWFARGFTLSICSPSTTRSEMLVGTCPLRLFSSKLSHPECSNCERDDHNTTTMMGITFKTYAASTATRQLQGWCRSNCCG